MQAVVNGLLTTYTRQGDGPLLVMLHGWGDSSVSFRGMADKLSANYEVICVDLPGFGQTQGPSEVWGLEDYAEFVRAFLKKTGTKDVYAFVGHSNGAAVLIKGLAAGLNAEKLVLLGAAGIRTGQSGRRFLFKVIAKTGKVLTFFLPERHKRALRKRLYGVAGSDMLVVPELQETFKKTVRQDVQSEAKKLTIPTLIIYGSDDRATPVQDGETFKSLIAGSRLEVVKDAGHYVHQEQPQQVLSLMKEFLK